MLTHTLKWASIAALLLISLSWRSAPSYEVLLNFVLCMGAIVVAVQAERAAKHYWMAIFIAVALVFNPVVPVLYQTGEMRLLLVLLTMALFVLSLGALKPQPLLSIPSITGRTPGSESL